jgi:peroxisomal enoyl-CoA hydratase 2
MALNLDVMKTTMEPVSYTYTKDDVILYALGIGAQADELDFVYEKDLKVFPTYAVIPFIPMFMSVVVPKINFNLFSVLHGEHKITLHKPIPPSGTIHTTTSFDTAWDKGDKGAVVGISFETRDDAGELLFENATVIMDRSAGNFGGERGPETPSIKPPEDKKPDFHSEFEIPLNQAALYRLTGDKTPFTLIPNLHKKPGLTSPLSMGYAALDVLEEPY